MLKRETFQIAIVGCGHVGMTTAYSLLLQGIPTKLILYSRNLKKLQGERLDLEHGLSFYPNAPQIIATTNPQDLKNTDLIIYTAGAAQKPGQTRLDLTKTNLDILRHVLPPIIKNASHALVLIVANPVDLLTYTAYKILNLPWGRVFGSGTLLDTSRFRFHLSQHLEIHPKSIHAYIMGEHGDSSFLAQSAATIGGIPLSYYPNLNQKIIDQVYQETRDAAYKIIAGKGATYYGIATALSYLIKTIKDDAGKILPLSVPLVKPYYQVKDIALSVPAILDRNGIRQTLTIYLSETEQQSLLHSTNTLKQALETTNKS